MSSNINKQIKSWFRDPLLQDSSSLEYLTNLLNGLNKLNLVNCQIDDEKMFKLAQALRDNQTLQMLEISNNNFSSLGLESLMNVISDRLTLSVITMDLMTGNEMQAQFNILMQHNCRFNKLSFRNKNNNVKVVISREKNQTINQQIKDLEETKSKELPLLPFHRNLPLSPLIGSYTVKLKKSLNENDKKCLENAFYQLIMRHGALRTQLTKNKDEQWCQKVSSFNLWFTLRHLNLGNLTKQQYEEIIKICEQSLLKTLEENLIAMMGVLFEWKNNQYLLIMFNHHHFDLTSQKIFFEELEMAFQGELPVCEIPYCEVVESLHKLAKCDRRKELTFWQAQLEQIQPLPENFTCNVEENNINLDKISKSNITQMKQEVNEASLKIKELLTMAHIQVDEVLLTAWIQVLCRQLNMPKLVINMITHGRGAIEDEIGIVDDVIGCFVTFYPVCFYLPSNIKGKEAVLHIKSLLEKVPTKGMRYGILRFCSPEISDLWGSSSMPYLFFHFQIATASEAVSENWEVIRSRMFNSLHMPNRLEPIWAWNQQQSKFYCSILHGSSYSSEIIEKLLDQYHQQIIELVDQLIEDSDTGSQIRFLDQNIKVPVTYIAPRNIVEQKLSDIWGKLLYREQVGIHDNFFSLGGSSLQIVRLVTRIKEVFKRSVSVVNCFKSPTIAEQAKFCAPGLHYSPIDPLLPVQVYPDTLPLFLVHPIEGNAFPYMNFSNYLKGYTIYGLNNPRFTEPDNPFSSIEEMAAYYLEAIRTIQPQGPYNLGGWSFGGTVALEMAQQLHAQAQVVNLVILIDTLRHTSLTPAQQCRAEKFSKHSNELPDVEKYMMACTRNHWNIQQAYCPSTYNGRVLLIKARDLDEGVIENIYEGEIPNHLLDIYGGWLNLIENIEICSVSGNHGSLLDTKNIEEVAKVIKEGLDTLAGHPLLDKKLPLAERLLFFALRRQDRYLVNALLKKNQVQLDMRDNEGKTALHCAIEEQ